MKALFVYVLLCIIFPFAAGPRLVLFDLKNLGVPGVLSEVASSMIRTRLVKSGKFTVLERKYLDSLFREQGESLKAEYSEEFRLRLGQMLSAEKAAAGYISPIGDDIIISLRLIDIETGNVE
ncbi:MAG: CsgG/HfaB family protein, partial [Fibrobacterota bacterium]